ncbi:MAG: hypothetical protein WBE72_14490 [Terracidiphilus sp.]
MKNSKIHSNDIYAIYKLRDFLNEKGPTVRQCDRQRAEIVIERLRNPGGITQGEFDKLISPLKNSRWRVLKREDCALYMSQTWTGSADFGLLLIAKVSETGKLERLQKCPVCAEWFLRYSAKQKFCTVVCQSISTTNRSKTEAGRLRARDAMRKHRQVLKQRAAAQKNAINSRGILSGGLERRSGLKG